MKIILLIYLCSAIEGNACKLIKNFEIEFKDMFECTVYGYSYSAQYITGLGREFTNEYQAYTQFMCVEKKQTTT